DGPPRIRSRGGRPPRSFWEPAGAEPAAPFGVIPPDSRGHGRSANPAGQLSYPRLADDIAALITALGLHRPVVGGWSDGGQVTLELAARHPGAAGALIAGAAYPDFQAGGPRGGPRALPRGDRAGGRP